MPALKASNFRLDHATNAIIDSVAASLEISRAKVVQRLIKTYGGSPEDPEHAALIALVRRARGR